MNVDLLGPAFAGVGGAVGYAVGGLATAGLAAIFGFFLGKVVYSTTRTFETD